MNPGICSLLTAFGDSHIYIIEGCVSDGALMVKGLRKRASASACTVESVGIRWSDQIGTVTRAHVSRAVGWALLSICWLPPGQEKLQ
jgi:hypothetical protein